MLLRKAKNSCNIYTKEVIFMAQYRKTNELQHHGIKGMKWGVRRFEDKNGKLTLAGKKRYKVIDKSNAKANMRSIYMDQSISEKDRKTAQYGMMSKKQQKKTADKWAKSKAEWNGEKHSRANSKKEYEALRKDIYDLNSKYQNHNKYKSDRQLKLEEKYMSKGVAPKDAENAARKRLKAEAFIAAAGVLTITSGGPQQAKLALTQGNMASLVQKAAVAYGVYSLTAPNDLKKMKQAEKIAKKK